MARFLLQQAATFRLDEIYHYSLNKWGQEKADNYIEGLFDAFAKVGEKTVLSHPIPAELGVTGFYFKYKKHFIYWKYLNNSEVGIVTILHERMHQIKHFEEVVP
ncbi:MAG: plasmid stabilization protein [Methylophaga sp.]|nr:MAG: plasmid stabilization protein [Methylophaga sp.]